MLLHLLAVLFIGLGAAGLVIGVARLAGRRAPRWLPPLAAGLGMAAFVLWSDYTWFERTVRALPGEVEVVRAFPERSILRPWTMFAAPTGRFAALQRIGAHRDEGAQIALVDLFLISRYQDPVRVRQAIDCVGQRRGDLDAGVSFEEGDGPVVQNWQPLEGDDPILDAACRAP